MTNLLITLLTIPSISLLLALGLGIADPIARLARNVKGGR